MKPGRKTQSQAKMWAIHYNRNNNNDIIIIFGLPIDPICKLA